MARILINNIWFEQVEPSTFTESELEERVILHAPSVYPEYFVVPFKCTVNSEHGTARADLAFIAKNYKEWRAVVEIEMGYHSLSHHVEPQVQKLADAYYDENIITYLGSAIPTLDRSRLVDLVSMVQPQVVVIVNQPKPDWEKALAKYGAIIVVFELFRSSDHQEIFRVNGEYPTQYILSISKCTFHPLVKRLLKVRDPAALSLPNREIIVLRYNNCITEWRRADAEGSVWLQPMGRNPLVPEHEYEIFRQSDETLILRRRGI
jgi:hypothetical protein